MPSDYLGYLRHAYDSLIRYACQALFDNFFKLLRFAQIQGGVFVFFDVFSELCQRHNVSCKKAALDIGLSNSITSKWKRTGATPNGETLQKIADYFGVTVGSLLGEESAPDAHRPITDEDLMFALFDGKATPAQLEEVKRFAAYVKARDEK